MNISSGLRQVFIYLTLALIFSFVSKDSTMLSLSSLAIWLPINFCMGLAIGLLTDKHLNK